MMLEELQFIEQQIGQLDQEIATLLSQHQDAVQRLAEVPGLGVDSAQQIIAEVAAAAATFPSEKHFSSWVGAYPGDGARYVPPPPEAVPRLVDEWLRWCMSSIGHFEVNRRKTWSPDFPSFIIIS